MSQLKDFQILKKLGEGAFSTVFSCKRISEGKNGVEYALKKIKMANEVDDSVSVIRTKSEVDYSHQQ